jgi:hypothetical protein
MKMTNVITNAHLVRTMTASIDANSIRSKPSVGHQQIDNEDIQKLQTE